MSAANRRGGLWGQPHPAEPGGCREAWDRIIGARKRRAAAKALTAYARVIARSRKGHAA